MISNGRPIPGQSVRLRRDVSTGRWPAIALAGLASSGLAAVGLYAAASPEPAEVLGSALLFASCAAAAGGVIGFLFGVPRVLSADPYDAAATARTTRQHYLANTNLEQVSDWLTKLLIGAGLTQLGSLYDYLRQLARQLAPAFGGRQDSGVVGATIVVEFLVLGFLVGWLLTRLLLASALTQADLNALESFVRAENVSLEGDHAQAEELRAHAMDELGLPHAEARRYVALRRQLPQGTDRTTHMQALVDAARSTAGLTQLTSEQVRQLFHENDEGKRIYALALMQGSAHLADPQSAMDAIGQSRSAFEQYQALILAERMLPNLSAQDRIQLHTILTEQLAPNGYIARSRHRKIVAEQLLDILQRSN